jgi:diacylglycerol kinase (ATP)
VERISSDRPALSVKTLERSVQIVVTPGSGEGRAMATAGRLRRMLRRNGWESRLQSFSNLADLTRWARTVEPDFSHLVAVGGDATLSAAAHLAIGRGIPFVPVPNGFGNVFARAFGHDGRAEQVLRLLARGEVRKVDVGAVGEELFLSHKSYGALEQIQQEAERGRQQPRSRFLRHLWYYGVARRVLFAMPLARIAVEIDDERVAEDAVLVTVANVETYRGFLSLTPQASAIDGMFDVFVVPRTSKLGLASRLVRIALYVPGRWRGVKLYRARKVVIVSDGRREELKTLRKALPLLVPAGAVAEMSRRTREEDAPDVTLAEHPRGDRPGAFPRGRSDQPRSTPPAAPGARS